MARISRRQHIVPQQMIRRFANDQGRLFELYKPTLSLGTKMRSPRGILFRDYYYNDRISSFDEEVLKPIEDKFGKHYTEIADKPWQNKIFSCEVGAAFVDWVSSHLCRTKLLEEMNKVLFKNENPLLALAYDNDPKLANNIVRSVLFEMYRDLFSRPLWKWKCKIFPDDFQNNLVLTDNPVCKVLGFGEAAGTLMVPLSKRRILFGGKKEIVEECEKLSIRDMNFCLSAWADRNIYAADKQTLMDIVTDLRGDGIISGPQEILEAARKPLFGQHKRVSTKSVPEDINLNKFWQSLKDSFGPSMLDSEIERTYNAD